MRAGELLREGQEKYDTADFADAIELWSQAYSELPAGPEAEQYRTVLVYQLAKACQEAYRVNGDLKYLRKAEGLFEQYIENLGPDDDETRSTAEEALAAVREKIAEEEAAEQARRDALAREAAAGKTGPKGQEDTPPPPPGNGLRIAGAVTLGVGAALMIGMGVALGRGGSLDAEGDAYVATEGNSAMDAAVGDLLARGRAANTAAVVTGVLGGALLLTGAALLTVDGVRRRKAVAVAPVLGPRFAGVGLAGRF